MADTEYVARDGSRRKLVDIGDGQHAERVDVGGDVTVDIGSAVEITNDAGNPVPVSGTVTASGPLTDAQLRAAAVTVDSELPAAGSLGTSIASSGAPHIASGLYLWDGTTGLSAHLVPSLTGDANGGSRMLSMARYGYNGATYDRLRSVSAVGDGLGVAMTMQPSSAAAHTTAAANTAVVKTYAAVASQKHRLTALSCSWSGTAPTVGLLTVEDGSGNTIWSADVTLALNTPQSINLPPGGLAGTTNTAMIITLAAGGASAVGKLNTAKLTA